MKRCPECGREYDNTMMFCLDDGAELLYGPASMDEPATAILSEPGAIATGFAASESPTRAQINTTDQTAIFPREPEAELRKPSGDSSERHSLSANRVARPLAVLVVAVLILVGGFFGYRYFSGANSKQIESIAVMPFVNESGNPDVEYLSDGMTEMLIRSLSQLPNLNVKARSSVFRYKGKETDAKTIGKELGVQAVLNGRFVGGRGEQLHLSLELVDAQTENVIWTEEYDRRPSELILLQNAIARDVSSKLRLRPSEKVGKNYTENAEAYQLYLQGRYFWNKRTVPGFKSAITCFEQALAIDPNYALAYSGLADSYALLAIYDGAEPKESMPKAKEVALKALALDNDLAEAHASFGQVLHNYEYDFTGAEREYKRAIELNPSYASAHQWYGELLANIGRFDDSAFELQRASEIDPFSLIINRMKGSTLFFARKYDASIEQLKRTIALDANFPGPHYDLFLAYHIKGSYAESVEEFAKWRELIDDKAGAALARDAFSKGGWQGFLRAMIDKTQRPSDLHHYHLAIFYIALGENDAAINELNGAYEERANDIYWLKQDPRLDPVRSDPRFQELLKKVGFPE